MAGKTPGPEGGQTNSSDLSWTSPARPASGSSNGKPASASAVDTVKSVAEALAATFHVDEKKLQRGIREDLAGALCVIQAGMKAEEYAPAEILEQTGYELRSVLSGVLKGLMEMLALVGITTVLGAGLGTAAGLLAGGAGALPGAVAGADFGFDVGMAILTWAGLGILAKQIGQGSEELYQTLKTGVEWAWVAKNLDGEARVAQVDKAAHQMAKAAGLMMVLVLRGILAYLLAKGAYRSTKGAFRTAQTAATKGVDAAADAAVADLVRTIRATKFGAPFAKWIEDNWEDLKNNKKLEPKTDGPAAAPQSDGGPGGDKQSKSGKKNKDPEPAKSEEEILADRRAVAQKFYENQGWNESRIARHMKGIDFSQPVEVVTLDKDAVMTQWQKPGDPQGNYYAQPGTDPGTLGINPDGKVPTDYVVTKKVQVLKSTAAAIKDWEGSGNTWQGGSTQYFTTDGSAFAPQ